MIHLIVTSFGARGHSPFHLFIRRNDDGAPPGRRNGNCLLSRIVGLVYATVTAVSL